VVDEIAALDLASIADRTGLDLAAWRRLSSARQRQALLRWLRGELAGSPPASLVERLMHEAHVDGHRRWPVSGGELRSYRGRLQRVAITVGTMPATPMQVDLSRPGMHEIAGWRGAFKVDRIEQGGIPLRDAAALEVRARAPGDRFQAGIGRPPRSLKLQFQSRGVAPNLRGGPIACRGDVPVFVPGLGIGVARLAAGR
jgi:tRNA(Ile)-lysidine synthase